MVMKQATKVAFGNQSKVAPTPKIKRNPQTKATVRPASTAFDLVLIGGTNEDNRATQSKQMQWEELANECRAGNQGSHASHPRKSLGHFDKSCGILRIINVMSFQTHNLTFSRQRAMKPQQLQQQHGQRCNDIQLTLTEETRTNQLGNCNGNVDNNAMTFN
jgi:hypothetical protein